MSISFSPNAHPLNVYPHRSHGTSLMTRQVSAWTLPYPSDKLATGGPNEVGCTRSYTENYARKCSFITCKDAGKWVFLGEMTGREKMRERQRQRERERVCEKKTWVLPENSDLAIDYPPLSDVRHRSLLC